MEVFSPELLGRLPWQGGSSTSLALMSEDILGTQQGSLSWDWGRILTWI